MDTKKYDKGKVVEWAEYDDEGRQLEMMCVDYNNLGYESYKMLNMGGDEVYNFFFYYDEKGRNIMEESYNGEGYLFSIIINNFDENDRLIESNELSFEDSSYWEHKIYGYDEAGNVIKKIFGSSKQNYQLISSIYDNRGNVIKNEFFIGADSIPIYSVEKYNKNGSTDIYYKYDFLGNLIEIKYIKNTNETAKEAMKYDEYGNIIEKNIFKIVN
jgi:hypothetical protein